MTFGRGVAIKWLTNLTHGVRDTEAIIQLHCIEGSDSDQNVSHRRR
jgi:hypothetical protein